MRRAAVLQDALGRVGPVKTGLTLAALAAVQLGAALVGQLAVLRIVGVGPITDAYVAAQAVPLVLAAVVSGSLQSVWLPRFARVSDDSRLLREEQAVAQGQTLKLVLTLSLALGIGSPFWAPLVFPGFSAEQLRQVVLLGAPLLAAGVLNGQSGLLTVGLRVQRRYVSAEVIAVAGTLAATSAIVVLVPLYGILAASYVALVRSLLVYAALMLRSGAPGIRLRRSETSAHVARQVRPLAAGSLLIKAGPLVDRFWSSKAADGGVTLLNIAQLGMNALAAIVERSILAPLIPEFARRLQQRDLEGMRSAYQACLRRTAVVVGGVGLLLLALRPIWEALLLAVLRVQPDTAVQIWWVCAMLLPALFVSVGGSAAVAVFYAFGETRVPTVIGIAGFAASLVFKGVLFHYHGILGIAAGTSLYLLINMLLYHRAVERRISLALSAPR